MDRPFPAYKGDEPYIFVSYSHEDSDVVFPGIQWLRDQGFNIWYDEGISPGASWREELAESILGCDLFIILISPRSANSDNCLKEVNYALEHDRALLAIHQEATQLSPGLELALSDRQAIFRHELTEEQYRDKVLSGVRGHIQQSQSFAPTIQTTIVNKSSWPMLISAGVITLAILAGSILLYMKPGEQVAAINPSSNPVQLGEPVVQVKSGPVITYGDSKSIAVLPFENLSDSSDDAYFASGIHEEILLRIAKVRDLDVKSRTSVLKYTEQRPALKQIARELEVGTILEGSVRRMGNRVRITVQLIDAATDSHLWAESYDRDLEDIFKIQSDVAQRIAGALQAELLPLELVNLEKIPTSSIEAYSFYLQSVGLFIGVADERQKTRELMEKALTLDPDYADALARLSRTYSGASSDPNEPNPAGNQPLAKQLAEKALELDPDSSEAHLALGEIHLLEWEWMDAIESYRKATELNPTDGLAWASYAQVLRATGRHREAMLAAEKSVRASPGIFGPYNVRTIIYYQARQYRKALAYANITAELFPEEAQNICWNQALLKHLLEMPDARSQARHCNEVLTGEDRIFSLYLVGWVAGLTEDRALALEILDERFKSEKERWVPPGDYAYIYLGLHDYDKALDYLEQSVEYRLFLPASFLLSSQAYDKIRDMPRFKALLKKVNLDQFDNQY